MRTDPKRFLFRMMLFLAFVGIDLRPAICPIAKRVYGQPGIK